jgi:hypothetical protein
MDVFSGFAVPAFIRYVTVFLTSALDRSERSVSRSGRHNSGERSRDSRSVGSWVWWGWHKSYESCRYHGNSIGRSSFPINRL